jgi:hypothetical protein
MARKYSQFTNIALLSLLLFGCRCKTPTTPVVYRVPVLETIAESNAGLRIVPEGPDGSYLILGGRQLRFRAQADSNLKVVVNNSVLPRRSQATTDSGWYEPSGDIPMTGSRGFFWDIAVELPSRVLQSGVKDFKLSLE